MRFEIELASKHLIFDSDLRGLRLHGQTFVSGRDGTLIYDQIRGLHGDQVELQMSTNTSTLIPALRILNIPYPPYFDERPVVTTSSTISTRSPGIISNPRRN